MYEQNFSILKIKMEKENNLILSKAILTYSLSVSLPISLTMVVAPGTLLEWRVTLCLILMLISVTTSGHIRASSSFLAIFESLSRNLKQSQIFFCFLWIHRLFCHLNTRWYSESRFSFWAILVCYCCSNTSCHPSSNLSQVHIWFAVQHKTDAYWKG